MKIRIGRNVDNSFIYYAFIALFCMNFMRRGGVVCFLFGMLMAFRIPMRFRVDVNYLAAFCTSLMISVFGGYHFGWMESVKALNIFLMYHIGYQGYVSAKNKERFHRNTVFAVYAGFSLFLAFTYLYNLSIGFETHFRTLQDIWDGELVSVTLIGLLTSVIAPCSFYCLFITKNKFAKLWSIFSLAMVLLTNMITATRTPYLLLLLVYVFMFFVYIANQNKRRVLNYLLLLNGLIAIIGLIYVTNTFGLREYIENSRIFMRFMQEGFENGRLKASILHIKYMLEYMWGGEQIHKAIDAQAHNIIQQTYDRYGCISAACITWVVCLLGMAFWKLLRKRKKRDIDFLLIAVYFSILVQMFFEPIMTGYPALLWSMLLIHGATNAYLKEIRTGELQ